MCVCVCVYVYAYVYVYALCVCAARLIHILTITSPFSLPSFPPLLAVVSEGHRNRRIGSHEMNKDSSRSHSLLSVHVEAAGMDATDGHALVKYVSRLYPLYVLCCCVLLPSLAEMKWK